MYVSSIRAGPTIVVIDWFYQKVKKNNKIFPLEMQGFS